MNSFLSELSRRHVIRVAGAYVVVGWAILQAASIIAPAMSLPQSAITFILFVLVLGFPVAIFLAWAFQVTPEGVKRNEMNEDVPIQRVHGTEIALILVAFGLVGASILMPRAEIPTEIAQTVPTESGPPAMSIVVLPFNNMLGDPELDYLVDGFSEDLTTKLATSSTPITVTGRNSAFAYKGKSPDLREVGAALDVRYVLEGSLRKMDQHVRATAQLIVAETGNHVWSESYDYPLEDILRSTDKPLFDLYPDVEAMLLQTEFTRLQSLPQENMTANDLALVGFAVGLITLGNQSIPAGMQILQSALTIDPNNLTAHWVSAVLCSFGPAFRVEGADDLRQDAVDHINQALKLDPNSSQIASAAALVYHNLGNQELALRHANRSVSLGPKDPYPYHVRSRTLLGTGDYELALSDSNKAFSLASPKHLNVPDYRFAKGLIHLALRQYGKAEEMFHTNLLLAQTSWNLEGLMIAQAYQGKTEAAQRTVETYQQAYPVSTLAFVTETARLQGWNAEYNALFIEGLAKAGLR